LTTEQIDRANNKQRNGYLAIIPHESERIGKQTMSSHQGLYEIIAPYFMFDMRFHFLQLLFKLFC
jgi:hypothetical protein